MFSTDWDVEKYKTAHESDEHWELRKKFMLAHQQTLPEDEVVCMAQVFTNIEFLGCRYPDETMVRVASLAEGVVEEFREKKKDTLKRTFVAASDAATSKVKGLHRRSDSSGQPQPTKRQNINFQPSSELQNPTPQHNPTKKLRDLPGPFGKYVIIEVAGQQQSPHNVMSRFISSNKLQYTCETEMVKAQMSKCTVTINNQKVCDATAVTGKEAKDMAVSIALDKLKQQCYTLMLKSNTVGQSVTQSDLSPGEGAQQEKLSVSNNVGAKLMEMMGWTGGGLGKKAQGIVEPVLAATTVRRRGLGITDNAIGRDFEYAIRNYVKDWLQSGGKRDLVFSNDFSKQDREIIHRLANKMGLKSRSYGKDEERRLVLSRKQTLLEIVQDLLLAGGDDEKYELREPTSS